MTPTQFTRAVSVLGADPSSRASRAARLVLVDGMGLRAASVQIGIDHSAVSKAARKIGEAAVACPCCGRAF